MKLALDDKVTFDDVREVTKTPVKRSNKSEYKFMVTNNSLKTEEGYQYEYFTVDLNEDIIKIVRSETSTTRQLVVKKSETDDEGVSINYIIPKDDEAPLYNVERVESEGKSTGKAIGDAVSSALQFYGTYKLIESFTK